MTSKDNFYFNKIIVFNRSVLKNHIESVATASLAVYCPQRRLHRGAAGLAAGDRNYVII